MCYINNASFFRSHQGIQGTSRPSYYKVHLHTFAFCIIELMPFLRCSGMTTAWMLTTCKTWPTSCATPTPGWLIVSIQVKILTSEAQLSLCLFFQLFFSPSLFCKTYLPSTSYQLRCTRSVSIPAPAYYAHLVAIRARFVFVIVFAIVIVVVVAIVFVFLLVFTYVVAYWAHLVAIVIDIVIVIVVVILVGFTC